MYFLSLEERKYQRKKRRPPAFFALKVLQAIHYRRVRRRVCSSSKQAKSVTAGDFFKNFFNFIEVIYTKKNLPKFNPR